MLYSWDEKLNIIKISVPPPSICRFNATSIKILVGIFVKIDKLILKFPWKCKLRRIAKQQSWRTYTDFKRYYKATVIKASDIVIKIDKWTRTNSPEINPHMYG